VPVRSSRPASAFAAFIRTKSLVAACAWCSNRALSSASPTSGNAASTSVSNDGRAAHVGVRIVEQPRHEPRRGARREARQGPHRRQPVRGHGARERRLEHPMHGVGVCVACGQERGGRDAHALVRMFEERAQHVERSRRPRRRRSEASQGADVSRCALRVGAGAGLAQQRGDRLPGAPAGEVAHHGLCDPAVGVGREHHEAIDQPGIVEAVQVLEGTQAHGALGVVEQGEGRLDVIAIVEMDERDQGLLAHERFGILEQVSDAAGRLAQVEVGGVAGRVGARASVGVGKVREHLVGIAKAQQVGPAEDLGHQTQGDREVAIERRAAQQLVERELCLLDEVQSEPARGGDLLGDLPRLEPSQHRRGLAAGVFPGRRERQRKCAEAGETCKSRSEPRAQVSRRRGPRLLPVVHGPHRA
jgi:hypothetical protein